MDNIYVNWVYGIVVIGFLFEIKRLLVEMLLWVFNDMCCVFG